MAILCPGSPVTTVIDVSIASPALAINIPGQPHSGKR